MTSIRYIILLFIFATVLFGQGKQKSLPEWARGAIWYQIFLDRFEDGDTSNDPILNPLLPDHTDWNVSQWTSNWYELTDAEKRLSTDFYTNAMLRSYGGDLQGVIKRLDYLSQLGVEVILLTPVFESSSFHRYDIKSYHHIDPFLGSTQRVDSILKKPESFDNAETWSYTRSDKIFIDFLREAHKRNIKVVVDIVLNHTSIHFPPFQDVVTNQEKSRYANWFDIISWDHNEITDSTRFRYKSMWNIKSFPLFKQDSLGFSPGVKQYFFSIAKKWLDPDSNLKTNNGIDGWRLLYPNQIPEPFLKDWVRYMKKLRPDILIVSDDWSTDNESSSAYEDYIDTKINFNFPEEIQSFFIDTLSVPATHFDQEINTHVNFSNGDFLINIVDDHERDRLASMILNPNRKRDLKTDAENITNYILRKPTAYEQAIQKYILLFQFTFVGSPMIYYGDEAGMWGGNHPHCRKPMLWYDKNYIDENSVYVNGDTMSYQNKFDSSIFNYYRQLIQLRREHIALRNGSLMTMMIEDEKGLYGYKRKAGDDEVFILFNTSSFAQDTQLKLSGVTEGQRVNDPLNDVHFYYQKSGLKIRVSPKTGLILIPQR